MTSPSSGETAPDGRGGHGLDRLPPHGCGDDDAGAHVGPGLGGNPRGVPADGFHSLTQEGAWSGLGFILMANPRAEAEDKLGGDYEARVLEPSPPAVTDPPYADDPVDPGEVPEGRELVSPVHNRGDHTWDEIAAQDPDIAPWCADRWLGAWKRLEPLPPSFAETRVALHKIAEGVVALERLPPERDRPALHARRLRHAVLRQGRSRLPGPRRARRARPPDRPRGERTSRSPAWRSPPPRALGDFYGLACSVLEQLRADEADGDPSLVQLWPEHFDIAIDLGSDAAGQRATYGASPGDDDHHEPYLYVSPWTREVSGELWNATGFKGAELGYSELIAADDQRRAALDFMRERYRALQEA